MLAHNLGVTWVAIEATTITTALLVGQHHGPLPLEAAWKEVRRAGLGRGGHRLPGRRHTWYATANAAGVPTLSWVQLTQQASSPG